MQWFEEELERAFEGNGLIQRERHRRVATHPFAFESDHIEVNGYIRLFG